MECLCHVSQCFKFFTSYLSCDLSQPWLIVSNGSLTWELFRLPLFIGSALTGRTCSSKVKNMKPIIFGAFGSHKVLYLLIEGWSIYLVQIPLNLLQVTNATVDCLFFCFSFWQSPGWIGSHRQEQRGYVCTPSREEMADLLQQKEGTTVVLIEVVHQ